MANSLQSGLRAMRLPVITVLVVLGLRTAHNFWQASFGPKTSEPAASSAESARAAEPVVTVAKVGRAAAPPQEAPAPSEEPAVATTDSTSRENPRIDVSRNLTLAMDAGVPARQLGNVLAARSARFAHLGTDAGKLLVRLLQPPAGVARDGAASTGGLLVGATTASAPASSPQVAASSASNRSSEPESGLASRTAENAVSKPAASGFTSPAGAVSPPVAGPRELVLANPAESGGTVYFLVDGREFALSPGQTQRLPAGRARRVHFDRGADYGEIIYTLSEGAYAFAVTEQGWDLVPQSPAP